MSVHLSYPCSDEVYCGGVRARRARLLADVTCEACLNEYARIDQQREDLLANGDFACPTCGTVL